MNIFVTDPHPGISARVLPDKHIVKMPLETCQMVSIIYSKWYYDWGEIPKADNTPYSTEKGAFRNHPCTKWAAESHENLAWLIAHGFGLCMEYTIRYQKQHSCSATILRAASIYETNVGVGPANKWNQVTKFTRAMPDEYKLDESIDTFTAYKMYIASKPWAKDNYLRMPDRKPNWMN